MSALPIQVEATREAPLSEVRERLRASNDALKSALMRLEAERAKNLVLRKELGVPDVDSDGPCPAGQVRVPSGARCVKDCPPDTLRQWNGDELTCVITAKTPSTTAGVRWLSGPSGMLAEDPPPPLRLTAPVLQNMADAYASGVRMWQVTNEALAGKRKMLFTKDGDIVFEQLASDRQAAAIDANGNPQIYSLAKDKTYTEVPAAKGTLGVFGVDNGYIVAGTIAIAAVAVIILCPPAGIVIGGASISTGAIGGIGVLTAAGIAAGTVATHADNVRLDNEKKRLELVEKCTASGKTAEECAKSMGNLAKAEADAAAKANEAGFFGQVKGTIQAATTGFTNIALIGAAAYIGFMVLNYMSSKIPARQSTATPALPPTPAPAPQSAT